MSLLLAYYGDDLTGSTDALEFLGRAGAKTVLFMEPPTPAQLEHYPGLQAVGIAGLTRAMDADQMEAALRPAFASLAALGVPHVHYKVCSTFDSSPQIGSIGKAIDIGLEIFGGASTDGAGPAGLLTVPVLGGAPALGRYCVFGNLFARMGIGSAGQIHRLDRHPSMSRHPTTPSDESDLRLHLSRQTARSIGLLDILALGASLETQLRILRGSEVVLIDTLYESQLEGIGRLLDTQATARTLFTVGSSAVEMALGDHWRSTGRLTPVSNWPEPGRVEPLLVASGSCSPVTARQIRWAVGQGFAEIALDVSAMEEWGTHVQQAVEHLSAGRSLILHTGHTPAVSAPAAMVGTKLGGLVRAIVGKSSGVGAGAAERWSGLRRLVIAGGDTSSYAARALGIEAVEMICPLVPGAPLCRVHAPGSPADGLEINLKGGQVGGEDYFGKLLIGTK